MDEHAKRLRRLRERLGLSQAQAAAAAGVSRDSWIRMEGADPKRRRRIDTITLARFLDHYNLPVLYIFTGHLAGLDHDLAAELLRIEEAERAEAAGRSGTVSPPAPARRKTRKSIAGTES